MPDRSNTPCLCQCGRADDGDVEGLPYGGRLHHRADEPCTPSKGESNCGRCGHSYLSHEQDRGCMFVGCDCLANAKAPRVPEQEPCVGSVRVGSVIDFAKHVVSTPSQYDQTARGLAMALIEKDRAATRAPSAAEECTPGAVCQHSIEWDIEHRRADRLQAERDSLRAALAKAEAMAAGSERRCAAAEDRADKAEARVRELEQTAEDIHPAIVSVVRERDVAEAKLKKATDILSRAVNAPKPSPSDSFNALVAALAAIREVGPKEPCISCDGRGFGHRTDGAIVACADCAREVGSERCGMHVNGKQCDANAGHMGPCTFLVSL